MPTKKADEKSFGAKMEQLRLAKKLSFEQLANLTGLSQRYLKEIEQGTANPSVSVVIQIAKALSIDSGSFLSAEEEASEKRRMERFYKRTQAYSYKTLTPNAEKKHMKAFLVTIDPRQDHKMVDYRHEGEEFVYVLNGQVEIIVGEDQHRLKKDETLHFDSGMAHKLRNLTDEEANLLVVIFTP
jgi:transcriptional regulator with XRE-family HTH domain